MLHSIYRGRVSFLMILILILILSSKDDPHFWKGRAGFLRLIMFLFIIIISLVMRGQAHLETSPISGSYSIIRGRPHVEVGDGRIDENEARVRTVA